MPSSGMCAAIPRARTLPSLHAVRRHHNTTSAPPREIEGKAAESLESETLRYFRAGFASAISGDALATLGMRRPRLGVTRRRPTGQISVDPLRGTTPALDSPLIKEKPPGELLPEGPSKF